MQWLGVLTLFSVSPVVAQSAFPGVTIEAEDFEPIKPAAGAGWKEVMNGGGQLHGRYGWLQPYFR